MSGGEFKTRERGKASAKKSRREAVCTVKVVTTGSRKVKDIFITFTDGEVAADVIAPDAFSCSARQIRYASDVTISSTRSENLERRSRAGQRR
jgi:hypothetical protein